MRSSVSGMVSALVLALGTGGPAHADEVRRSTSRSSASTVGLGLLALSLASAGLGVAGLASATDARAVLAPYVLSGGASQSPEAAVALDARQSTGVALAIGGLAGAGACLVAAIVLLVADTPSPAIAWVPTAGGGVLSYSLPW